MAPPDPQKSSTYSRLDGREIMKIISSLSIKPQIENKGNQLIALVFKSKSKAFQS